MMEKRNQREEQRPSVQTVILCGGLATRLRPLTNNKAKSMIPVAGRPFLWHQIQLLKKNGIVNIILCIGFKGNQIKKYFGDGSKFGVRIKYGKQLYAEFGTGGYLKKIKDLLEDEFLLMYGD